MHCLCTAYALLTRIVPLTTHFSGAAITLHAPEVRPQSRRSQEPQEQEVKGKEEETLLRQVMWGSVP